MYTVYVLKNETGKLYIGQTIDLSKRLQEHNKTGKGYTSKYRPWLLLWSEAFVTRQESIKRERYLKTGVGRDWIKKNILRA
ncbi:MAG TPA: GIY-YIG nuclease family protein [Candidatus Paceibacterota bacterium]